MKKRIFSLMVVFLLVVSSVNVFAANAWLQDNKSTTKGLVETEVIATATHGSAELVTGNAPTDSFPLNYDYVEFKFTADPGYMLGSQDENFFGANNPLDEEYYYSTEMRALWPGSEDTEIVLPDLDKYYDLVTQVVDTDNMYYLTIRVAVVRNDVEFPEGIVYAHLEPELSATVSASFIKEQDEEYYSVTASSIPSGVATFTGTGDNFAPGDPYLVGISKSDSDYQFVEWVTPNEGTIYEGDVEVIAKFKKKSTPPPVYHYSVTAVSNPAGVATFTGTGSGFVYGSDYEVQYTPVVDGYVFTGWTGDNIGQITGNVNLIANFEPVVVPEYNVTAISQPEGVATFEGTLSDVEDGTGYNVSIASINEGYEFVEWSVDPTGTINGSDVQVVAVFKEVVVEETILDENVAQNIPDETLPEAGGIPAVGFGAFGFVISMIGKRLRK